MNALTAEQILEHPLTGCLMQSLKKDADLGLNALRQNNMALARNIELQARGGFWLWVEFFKPDLKPMSGDDHESICNIVQEDINRLVESISQQLEEDESGRCACHE
ncbi:hypothetical protein [Endozoicomonas sp. 4G]|uniref:hypothetical protein n=1 Tax=Endozoicomonas sp. 4G TaxID=2872754 RepID=UPI002078905B|nr:hypothetical protein [Endozoicomonas sp. 4G]